MPVIYRHFSDLDFNFIPHPLTGDVSKTLDAAAIKASIKNLVLTNHFERPFHPEIGSGVAQLLFENATPLTAIYIQRAIQDVLNNFEPRATLQSVNVSLDPDKNGFQVDIVFFINNVPNPINIDFFLQKLR